MKASTASPLGLIAAWMPARGEKAGPASVSGSSKRCGVSRDIALSVAPPVWRSRQAIRPAPSPEAAVVKESSPCPGVVKIRCPPGNGRVLQMNGSSPVADRWTSTSGRSLLSPASTAKALPELSPATEKTVRAAPVKTGDGWLQAWALAAHASRPRTASIPIRGRRRRIPRFVRVPGWSAIRL